MKIFSDSTYNFYLSRTFTSRIGIVILCINRKTIFFPKMTGSNSTVLEELNAFRVAIVEELGLFFVQLSLMLGKALNWIWTRVLRLDNIRLAFWSVVGFFRTYVLDVSWATMRPLYKGGRRLVVSVNPLWDALAAVFGFLWGILRFVFDAFLHLVDVVRILVPLEHLITLWFLYVQWIPLVPLRYPVLRLMFAAWYPYVAASAWVRVWNILVNVLPVWQVLVGRAVHVKIRGQHFLYALASAFALWRLHLLIGTPSLRKYREPARVTSIRLHMERDYLKEFGGAMRYVEGELRGADLPKTKSELKKVQKLRSIRKKEMEQKLSRAVKHFLKEHEDSFVGKQEENITYEKTPHTDCSKMCAVVEDGHGGKKGSPAHSGDAQKRFWSNKRFYGIIGNVIARSMRKSKLVPTGNGVPGVPAKEDSKPR